MSFLEVDHISRQLDGVDILKEISFIQQPFQKIAVTGETGSGKSTLLKIIAGLTQPHAGGVRLNNIPVQGPAEKLIPGHPGIAYLSQQYELPKFLSVGQVLGYASKISEQDSLHLYEVCHITHLLNRKTDQLSGGEQQRIALARLLTGSPILLLLDEPFSNLDMIHKLILKQVIRDVSEQLRITCILVSHDPLDTVSWADEMIVLKNGRVIQQGPPEEVYRRPVNEYAAGLFGKYNLLSPALSEAFSSLGNASTGGKQLLIRPEQFTMSIHKIRGLQAVVKEIFFTGSTYEYELMIGGEVITVRTASNNIPKDTTVHVFVSPGGVWAI